MSLTDRLINLMDVRKMPDKALPPTGLWFFVWHFCSQYRLALFGVFAFSLFSSTAMAMGPYMLRFLLDTIVKASDPRLAWPTVFPALGLYILIAIALNLTAYGLVSYLRATTYGSGLVHCVRRQLHWYVLQQSYTYFQNDFAGRLASKLMDTGSEIRTLVNVARRLVWVVITFLVASVTLGLAQPWLLAPFGIWAFLFGVLMRVGLPEIRRLSMIYADTRGLCMGRIVDAYTNIQSVKLFANQEREDEDVMDAMHEARTRHANLFVGQFKLDFATLFLEAFLVVSLLVTSLWLWSEGRATAGTIAMVLPLSMMLVNQTTSLREELSVLLESLGTIEDAIETLIKPITIMDAPQAKTLPPCQGIIAFNSVTFHYNIADEPIIEGMNLTLSVGQKVGLIGPSGGGKSTLVNLLLRFYDVQNGSITVDGYDIRDVTQNSLRSQIGVVTQDTSLLHRSIAENIRYGKPSATDAEVEEAARKAHAHDFILKLVDKDGNNGYAAKVGERGVKLSGGQRQRVAIARLILKNAPILILDEATSALDSEVEIAIQENLTTLMEGKTVIAIAHRLSTISKLDRLLVLDQGRIVEDGTHAELLRRKGLYARLWAHQSGGFFPDEV